jgi:hypothetical protein
MEKEKQEETKPFEFVLPSQLRSIDQIVDKFRHAYYHNYEKLLSDLQTLVLNTIKNRCKNELSKVYLTHFLTKAQEIIKSKRNEHHQKWITFFGIKLTNN